MIIRNLTVAMIIGVVIFIFYGLSRSAKVYNLRYNVSLFLMTLFITLIMSVMGKNIIVAIGALFILIALGFSESKKDAKDVAFLIWYMIVGLCCGISEYYIAGLGTLLIIAFILFLGLVHADEVYLLFIRAGRESEREVDSFINEVYKGKVRKQSNNVDDKHCELIYQISGRMLRKRVNGFGIREALYDIDSVSLVDISCLSDFRKY